MSKKMMVLALAVACAAVFALPAAASAQTAHFSVTTSFSLAGGGGTITSASGSSIACSGIAGSGAFSTTTSGSASLLISGCSSAGFSCSNTGTAGQIALSYSFNTIMVSAGTSTGKAGILLTPTGITTLTSSTQELAEKKLFTEFSCLGFISIKVYGNGMIGTIEQACNTSSSTFKLSFESAVTKGTQQDLEWTGKKYDLINSQSGHPTMSFDGTTTMTLAAARQLHCT
jgi:hypothetical protein